MSHNYTQAFNRICYRSLLQTDTKLHKYYYYYLYLSFEDITGLTEYYVHSGAYNLKFKIIKKININ